MAVEVFGADEQSDVSVDLATLVALCSFAFAEEGAKGDAEASLFFVDAPTMADLHLRYMDLEGPTDVMSFPMLDEPLPVGRHPDAGTTGPGFEEGDDEPEALIGDIVICPVVAQEHASTNGVAVADELKLLVVHGVLHLMGWDHQIDSDAEKMEAREAEVLSRFAERSA